MSILDISTFAIFILLSLVIGIFIKIYPSVDTNKHSILIPAIFLLVGLTFTVNIFAELAFVFSQPISRSLILSAIVFLIISYWFLFRANYEKLFLITNAAMVAVGFVASTLIFAQFWDGSWDGRAYHQIAALAFSNGWNPLETDIANIWVNAYPKASWISAGAIDLVSGNLEASKSINFLAIVATLASVMYLCSLFKIKSLLLSFLIAVAVVANPVVIRQLFTLYLDGYMFLCFVIAIVFLISTFIRSEQAHISEWFIAVMALAMLSNLKFTGFVYAVIILGVIYGYRVIFDKRPNKKSYLLLSIASILAIFIIGANPYLKNITSGAHIFHPVMGSQKHDWVDNLHPPCLAEHNRVSDLVLSNFSKTVRSRTCEKIEIGIPFNIKARLKEFNLMAMPDWRMSGFGPYFSSVIILTSLIGYRILLSKYYKQQSLTDRTSLILMGVAILISTLVNPELWSARYVPQLWLIWLLALLPFNALQYRLLEKLMALGIVGLLVLTGYVTLIKHTQHTVDYTKNIKNFILLAKQKGEIKYSEGDYPFRESFDNTFFRHSIKIIPSSEDFNDICGLKLKQKGKAGGYYIEFDNSKALKELINNYVTLRDIIRTRKQNEILLIGTRGNIQSNLDYISTSVHQAGLQALSSEDDSNAALIIDNNSTRWITGNKTHSINSNNRELKIVVSMKTTGSDIRALKFKIDSILLTPRYAGVHIIKLNQSGAVLSYYHVNPNESDVIRECSLNY